MRVIAKEVADAGDVECACCGRMHKKMHRMNTGAVMGSRCAELVERLTDGGSSFQRHYRALLSMSHPNSPALRFQ